jgi:putative transposase
LTEEQIIGILRGQEGGQRTADVCRRHGISEGTFYKWKVKYGGMDVSDAKRLKAGRLEKPPRFGRAVILCGEVVAGGEDEGAIGIFRP